MGDSAHLRTFPKLFPTLFSVMVIITITFLNAVQMFYSETQTYPLTLFGVF